MMHDVCVCVYNTQPVNLNHVSVKKTKKSQKTPRTRERKSAYTSNNKSKVNEKTRHTPTHTRTHVDILAGKRTLKEMALEWFKYRTKNRKLNR